MAKRIQKFLEQANLKLSLVASNAPGREVKAITNSKEIIWSGSNKDQNQRYYVSRLQRLGLKVTMDAVAETA